MAKWGEGDPRWIVEERPDATNVNNWHWAEKDAKDWSRTKLKELFVGLKIESDAGSCEIKDVTKMEGEAFVLNRRGKLSFLYDWVLEGSWEGKLVDGQKNIKGKFDIPNFAQEEETSEVQVNVSIDKNTDEARAMKEIMRTRGRDVIHQQLDTYISLLQKEYSQGLILPSKTADANAKGQTSKENTVKQEMNKVVENASSAPKQPPNKVGVRIPTTTVAMKETFRCPADVIYRAITDEQMMKVYTGDSSVVVASPGGRFVLMDGNVLGEFTELVPNSKVCMQWRMKSWPEEHYSNVTIDLEEREGDTVLSMKQTGVPKQEKDRTHEGWKVNFWERIKNIFRIGNNI